MSSKQIYNCVKEYQKSRSLFVSSISDHCLRSHNIEYLLSGGVLDLLKPLLADIVPSIQQTAAIAIGRLANHNEIIAEAIARKEIIPQLINGLPTKTKYYKKSALFALRTISKHNADLAMKIVDNGGLDVMLLCLEDYDNGVKESAAWAVGYIARHSEELARAVADTGLISLLILCLQEPELCLKQVAASSISDIAKHSHSLALTVADTGAITFLAKAIKNTDVKLKIQALGCLAQIARHSVNLAELVVEAEIFPEVRIFLTHPDDGVKKNSAVLTREITKHTMELAQLVVNTGGIGALTQMINTTKGSVRIPAIMTLGYICGHSDQLALAVINSGTIDVLENVLEEEKEDLIKSTIVWALGQCGKHSPQHAQTISDTKTLQTIIELYSSDDHSPDLKCKCETTLKLVLQKTVNIAALLPLLKDCPANILKYVLGQFSKILPNDPYARKMFVASGALKKLQEIQADPGSTLFEYITIVNCCFPDEVVQFYSPGYSDSLLETVEQYQPQIPPLLVTSRSSSETNCLQNISDLGEESSIEKLLAV